MAHRSHHHAARDGAGALPSLSRQCCRCNTTRCEWIIPLFTIYAGVAYRFFRLYESKWRFASLPDLFNIFRAASLLAISLLVLDFALIARGAVASPAFGDKACFVYWVLQMSMLGGPRIAYRYFRYVQARRTGRRERAPSILVLGRSTEAEIALRSIEEGMRRRFVARGVLSPRATDRGASIRGVPVLGGYDELERIVGEATEEGNPIARLIFAPSEFTSDADSERVVATAKRLGVALSRLQTVEFDGASALAPIEIEDLLFRPSVQSDLTSLRDFVNARRVVVTGGGGSIGSEICARVAALGAADLLILDNSEPALFAVSEQLEALNLPTRLRAAVADVRDRPRLKSLFEQFRPDVVFHAAALKQVPQLEARLGRGRQDEYFRFGQCRRRDGRGRRGRRPDLDRQGGRSRSRCSARRSAFRKCTRSSSMASGAGRPGGPRTDFGALRQCAGLGRLGRAEVQGADRARRSGDGDASGNGALFHDRARGGRSRHFGRRP